MNVTEIKKKYPAYPINKPSGIDWLGNIPENWEVKKIKYLVNSSKYYQLGDGDHGSITPEMYQNEGIPYIRVQNLSWEGKLNFEGIVYISPEIQKNNPKSKIICDDILIAKTGATIGKVAIVPKNIIEANTTSSVGKLTVDKSRFSPKYILYSLISRTFQDQIWVDAILKSAQPGFNIDDFIFYLIICPPLKKQYTIASFLDRKTLKIDELVKKKQKIIEILQEKRTVLISQAVTKGLDPQAELKSSGVDWLGYIPDDWKVKRLKDVTSINPETLSENTPSEYYLKYIDISNVDSEGKIIGIAEMYFENAPSRARRIVIKKDVIISTVRTYLKAISYLDNVEENTIVSTGFAVLRSKKNILPNFLNYFVRSNNFIDSVMSHSEGVSYPAINPTILGGLKICFPNIEQQKIIADFLDTAVNKINKAIEKIQQQIEFIKEYRMALIANTVTGKIMIN